MILVLLVGLYLIFFGKEEKIKIIKEQLKPKQITKENFKDILDKMKGDDKTVFETVIDSKGEIYQSKLVEKTGFTKVKISRILGLRK